MLERTINAYKVHPGCQFAPVIEIRCQNIEPVEYFPSGRYSGRNILFFSSLRRKCLP